MLNWVAFSSCNRWSSSLRPPPSSDDEEKAGGGSAARGDRGLHTVLHDSSQQWGDVRHEFHSLALVLVYLLVCYCEPEFVAALNQTKTNITSSPLV